MVEVYHQISEGKLRRDTKVTLRDSDKAGDETVPLNMLHDGVQLTVSDLLNLMIAYSDNTATNLLVGLVGTSNIDRRMASYGLNNTKIFRPTFRDGRADVFPEEEKEFGLGMTTPREAARLMELIAQGKIVSRAVGDEMLAILRKQQDRAMIPRSLPSRGTGSPSRTRQAGTRRRTPTLRDPKETSGATRPMSKARRRAT
jgi:beta-lactamase class A